MVRKTKLQQRVEKEHEGEPIERLLQKRINRGDTNSEIAEELRVNKATLGYWLLGKEINVKRVAFLRGEKERVVKND